jgi:hypothetical protein
LERRIVTSRPRAEFKAQVLDVERDQLRAPERGGEAEQQQRTVAQTGECARVDEPDHPPERLQLQGLCLALRPDAAGAPDPRQRRGDRG